jgi:hypothetical protein
MYSANPKPRAGMRFPDRPSTVLAYTAMLMAARTHPNKISPEIPCDKDIYAMSPEELDVPTLRQPERPSTPGRRPRIPDEGYVFTRTPSTCGWNTREKRKWIRFASGRNPHEFHLYIELLTDQREGGAHVPASTHRRRIPESIRETGQVVDFVARPERPWDETILSQLLRAKRDALRREPRTIEAASALSSFSPALAQMLAVRPEIIRR